MQKKHLTVRKQKWIERRKPEMVRGTTLNPNMATAGRFYQQIAAMVEKMTSETQRTLDRMFDTKHAEEYFALDASLSSQARITTNALMRKFDALFAKNAKRFAEQMVAASDRDSSSSLHSSIQQLSGGLSLPTTTLRGQVLDIMNASTTEAAGLIKSIPKKYLSDVQGAVMRSITSGNGLQDLVPFLEKHRGMTMRRARNIALDQTRKAYNSINKGRMQDLGLDEYEWMHSGGGDHPREYHLHVLNGKIFKLSDPPVIDPKTGERGIPGQLPNCKCKMRPVIKLVGGSDE